MSKILSPAIGLAIVFVILVALPAVAIAGGGGGGGGVTAVSVPALTPLAASVVGALLVAGHLIRQRLR